MMTAQNYRDTQILTASPMELIIMLYEEGIRTLRNAEAAFELEGPERLQEINNNLLHAEDIITELAVALDIEKGGQIALNLQRLYDFMLSHLSRANMQKVLRPVVEVRELLTELRDTWRQVGEKEPKKDIAAATADAANISMAG